MDIRPPSRVMAWLGPLVLINAFIWIVVLVPEANAPFCEKTTNCLATWASAAGGAGTVLTALLLVWQIRLSERHHRRATALQLRPIWKLAEKVERLATNSANFCEEMTAVWNGRDLNDLDAVRLTALQDIKLLRDIVDGDDFRRMQQEIDIPNMRVENMLNFLSETYAIIDGATYSGLVKSQIVGAFAVALTFFSQSRAIASEYLEDMKQILR
ncbi:MAG TPA: hypothetical protein VFY63_14350 [Pseudorhizobium sp.]|nr:hypothetical protein [Pseudorhizobium sp.]